MRRVRCPLCGESVDEDLLDYHRGVEDYLVDTIREHNPAWVLPDGTCPKAQEYYLAVILGKERG